MRAVNITPGQLDKALTEVNKLYDGNIVFKRGPEYIGRTSHFTLTVKNSNGLGARRSAGYGTAGRKIAAACWHVHGYFFEAVFNQNSISPNARIRTAVSCITGPGENEGNWQDKRIGPPIAPVMYSEACEC